jgi:hypothetical protein
MCRYGKATSTGVKAGQNLRKLVPSSSHELVDSTLGSTDESTALLKSASNADVRLSLGGGGGSSSAHGGHGADGGGGSVHVHATTAALGDKGV